MPDTENPKMSEWLPALKEVIGESNEDLYLIGHSLGCAIIMRYMESMPDNVKIGGGLYPDSMRMSATMKFRVFLKHRLIYKKSKPGQITVLLQFTPMMIHMSI